ncbi:MAG TPA: hypothetical protein VGX25_24575 [Actinophytocola sp.]|uniref:hypothetical protein n=1 Tax=Actinophytocola sp. TaxID=1872138 RepID=UPI002DDCB721|nr:hypothetical protein [Actinophytocola sp.]HEV2782582.1 hypothetical protein [Actinophytocola sp.]
MTRNRALVDIDALADLFPHRIARATELIRLGLSSHAIYTNCLPGGRWQRIAPGVILLAKDPPTRPQLIASALRHAGPGAIVTGWDALHHHGMSTPPAPGEVHLLVPHGRQVRNLRHVLIERTTKLPTPVPCNGFPIAPLPRAVTDTARRLTAPDAVRKLLAEVIQRGRLNPAWLRHELDTGSNRGSALPRRILDELSSGIRSMAEGWARRLVHRTDLPQPLWNTPIRTPDGDHLGIMDAWWPELGLAWDLDSYQFHLTPAAHAESMRRHARLKSAGIIVLHTPPAQLRDHSTLVLDELLLAHHHATLRPPPPIVTDIAGAS